MTEEVDSRKNGPKHLKREGKYDLADPRSPTNPKHKRELKGMTRRCVISNCSNQVSQHLTQSEGASPGPAEPQGCGPGMPQRTANPKPVNPEFHPCVIQNVRTVSGRRSLEHGLTQYRQERALSLPRMTHDDMCCHLNLPKGQLSTHTTDLAPRWDAQRLCGADSAGRRAPGRRGVCRLGGHDGVLTSHVA